GDPVMIKSVGPSMLSAVSPSEDTSFRYGWRYVKHQRADGSIELKQVPLTLEDVLHPQEEDCIPESPAHEKDRRYLHDLLERRFSRPPHGLTLSDCLIDWGIRGLRSHSPDITVLFEVRHRLRSGGTFRIAKQGGRPVVVIEITSPDTRSNDVGIKVEHYHRAGVLLYILVDRE